MAAAKLEIIQGDLCFKLVNFGGFYGFLDSTIREMELMIDSLDSVGNVSGQDQGFIDFVKALKENELIHKAFFHLRTDSTQAMTIYGEENQHEKINKLDIRTLMSEHKKVSIRLKGRVLNDGLIDCRELVSIDKVDGEKYWRE